MDQYIHLDFDEYRWEQYLEEIKIWSIEYESNINN